MDPEKHIGRNIKILRTNLALSQDDLAGFLKIKRENISYYETGVREIPLNHLVRLADLFGLELNELLSESLDPIATCAAFAFRTEGITPDDLDSLAAFRKIVKNYLKLNRLEKRARP